MRIELCQATVADRQRLENLLELYAHDFSEIVGGAPDATGRFGYPGLDAYWREPGRVPYLLRADGKLAGFALIARGSQVSGDAAVFDVAEFFVVRGLRRRGVGLAAAHAVFASAAGEWEVRVMRRNAAAQPFWERAVASFSGGRFSSLEWRSPRGSEVRVFRFASAG
ncbi:MAG: GNAT family N-acetyltransferase [bacterium]